VQFSLLQFFGEILFPSFCCSCKQLGPYLCTDCYEQLEFYVLPIPISSLKVSPLYLDRIISAVVYEPTIGSVLHFLKYKHAKEIGHFLGDFLYFTTSFPKTDLITGIPLHFLRQAERGYNQSDLIGQRISKHSKIEYKTLLQRNKLTSNQASLQFRAQRFTNLQNIFIFIGDPKEIANKSILLIDDVCTTGTTLNECAKVLKEHGASSVVGLTIAHGN